MASKLTRLSPIGVPEASHELKVHSGNPYTHLGLTGTPHPFEEGVPTLLFQVDAGVFPLTADDINTSRIDAEPGVFPFTSDDVTLTKGIILSVDAGVFPLTSADVLLGQKRLTDGGVFPLTAADVQLSTPSSEIGSDWFNNRWWVSPWWGANWWGRTVAIDMSVDPAIFPLTADDVRLSQGRELEVDPGVFPFTSDSVTFTYARALPVDPGVFPLTGDAVTRDLTMVAGAGVFTMHGGVARLAAPGDVFGGRDNTRTRIGIRIGI